MCWPELPSQSSNKTAAAGPRYALTRKALANYARFGDIKWMSRAALILFAAFCCAPALPACAWGDLGHEVVGLIADHYLDPAVRSRVNAILASDPTRLTASTSLEQEATWADRFRDSDREGARVRYEATRDWHFVDLELRSPDLRAACFGYPRLPPDRVASEGVSRDCIVDKIYEFTGELSTSNTNRDEQRVALQFLLHLVGDLHQPLHASDYHDHGGTLRRVSADGMRRTTLHQAWDVQFVERLGSNPQAIARRLIANISAEQRARWSAGDARQWAFESINIARTAVYGHLPDPGADRVYRLPQAYVAEATVLAAQQLSRAGVRLAYLLDETLR